MKHDTERLSEWLDGGLDAARAAVVEQHLADCAGCRATVDQLRRVRDAAATLEDTPPAADLWPGILQRIEAGDDATVVPIGAARTARRTRRFSLSLPQLAAAAVVLMSLSGASVWLALRDGASTVGNGDVPVAGTAPVPAVPAAQLVSETVQSYDDAIRELEAGLEASRPHLDPATVAVVEQNLQIIDSAIAEARSALANDPANAWLHRHLDDTLMRKVDLLRRAATLRRTQT
jgi:hypothetical protein